MNIVKHIRMNVYFSLKMLRDMIMVLLLPGRLHQRYEYKGNLFDDGSNLERHFDKFRLEIVSLLGVNFFTISYQQYSYKNLIRHFIFGSQFIQMLRWYVATHFLSTYESNGLTKFYNGSVGRSYCGVIKLNNAEWLRSRIIQFDFLESFFEGRKVSYIEIGGSSGVLPLFAAYLGYDYVANSDFNEYDVALSIKLAKNLRLGNFTVVKDVTEQKMRSRFDIVSCHQVIEHTPDPSGFLKILTSLISSEGLLVLSHGYHLPVYPGHIPHYSERELEECFSDLGLIVLHKSEGNTYYLKKIVRT